MTFKLRKQAGFTLIEITIVIVILAIVAGASAVMLRGSVPGALVASDLDNTSWQVRVAMTRMEREIREANPASITVATATQFIFVDTRGDTIAYTLVGGQLYRNLQPIADNISGFAFIYFNASGGAAATSADIRYVLVGIIITVDGIASPTMLTSIALRNTE